MKNPVDGPPSALLSEGFCPVGHGPLDRDDDGWCPDCGLIYSIKKAPGPWGHFKYVHMKYDSSFRDHHYVFAIEWFDNSIQLEQNLRQIRAEMERTADYTQWRSVDWQ